VFAMPQTGQSGSVDESVAADIQSNQSEWNFDFMTGANDCLAPPTNRSLDAATRNRGYV